MSLPSLSVGAWFGPSGVVRSRIFEFVCIVRIWCVRPFCPLNVTGQSGNGHRSLRSGGITVRPIQLEAFVPKSVHYNHTRLTAQRMLEDLQRREHWQSS